MSDEASAVELYLKDLSSFLKGMARDARAKFEVASPGDRDFASGRAMAFYEVLSLMQQQAVAFDLPPEVVGLGDIDIDRELL